MAITSKIKAIADAIRAKTGKTAYMTLAQMPAEIASIETDPGYETPTITVSTGGLITATSNGLSGTKQLTTQAAKTVTPSTTQQTAVSSGRYTTGAVTVSGDSNLTGANIVSGKSIFGVDGTHSCPTPTYDTPSIEVSTGGLITASANGKSGTKQLTTQAGKTVTPTTSSQTAVASQRYTTGTVTVGAIPSQYIVPSGSQTLTKNDTYDVTSLASVIVSVSGGGGGSLPSGISAFDFGQINITTAFTTTRNTFTHKLGVTPDLMIVWAPANIATTYSMMAAIRGNQFGWRSSAYNNHMAYHGNSTTNITWTNSNSTSYGISNMTASNFQLASASSSYYWRAGTYNYIAIKFS